jgi:hypothetical protein
MTKTSWAKEMLLRTVSTLKENPTIYPEIGEPGLRMKESTTGVFGVPSVVRLELLRPGPNGSPNEGAPSVTNCGPGWAGLLTVPSFPQNSPEIVTTDVNNQLGKGLPIAGICGLELRIFGGFLVSNLYKVAR